MIYHENHFYLLSKRNTNLNNHKKFLNEKNHENKY